MIMRRNYKKLLITLFIIVSAGVGFWYFSLGSGNIKCKDCNLIMISLSNVSAQHMSMYGYERVTTPSLDKWAKDAIVFEDAFTQTSWTLPVGTSLFTSLYPYSHKVVQRLTNNVLDKNIQTLPEILKDRGYKTAAFVGGLDYSNRFGHMRGFEEVGEAANFSTAILFSGFGHTLEKASSWLEKNFDKKFFLFIHGYDTHCPFDPPEPFLETFSNTQGKNLTVDKKLCLRGYKSSDSENYEAYYYTQGVKKIILTQDDIKYLEALYDEEILSVDDLVGNFLENLNKTIPENTVIVIFSDHGEMFAKHGRFGRAGGIRGTLYDDIVRVPLMMKVPKQNGKTVKGLVQTIDVMPTLLHILDLPQPKQTQGRNLVPLINGEKSNINKYVFTGGKFGFYAGQYSETIGSIYPSQSIAESVRSEEWKLIHETIFDKDERIEEDTYELYNLKDDPDELRNLREEQPDVLAELQVVLQVWKDKAQSYDVKNISSPQLLPKEIIEQAKEYGYW